MPNWKYEIIGIDEEGDSWTFSTNDKQRAEEMLAEMKQDFETVEMKEK